MRIAFGQINPTVGDIAGNAKLVEETIQNAAEQNCDLVLFPELCLTGYPPEDLLLKPSFIDDNLAALNQVARVAKRCTAVVGFVDQKKNRRYNAAAVLQKGRVQLIYHKRCLPNYGVFDEKRYFSTGSGPAFFSIDGVRFGLTICEDIWVNGDHLRELRLKKPDFIVNVSASPYHAGKLKERQNAFKAGLKFIGAPLLYCNLVGGQDELVFDGGSFVADAGGRLLAQAQQFEQGLFVFDTEKKGKSFRVVPRWQQPKPISLIDEVYRALLMGLSDYVKKNGFKKVALGISGGIDSALVATLAVHALGPENVIGVTMPSRFNLDETRNDAHKIAKNLGIRLIEIPIQNLYQDFLNALSDSFEGSKPNLAEENLQARIRGNMLMALSNKFGWLILTTGNKSETSTGYCTLYGDTAGGFAILKDVLKTTVYALANHINQKAKRDVIPQSTIDRAPTAELRENQKDEDSLGSYANLDKLIVGYVENNESYGSLVKSAPDQAAYIKKILTLIDHNEYKRRQAPPGIKITPHAFGKDHRMPITNKYKH